MEINHIRFSYQDKVERLKDVTATIEKGKITTILGPNGCGKSTLLSVLAKFNVPSSGDITLNGKALHQYTPKELAKTLSVVQQSSVAPEEMTVEKLVYYGRLPYQKMFTTATEEDDEKVLWALEKTGLLEKKDALLSSLSGGQQQRAWIALALAQNTPYLFLDEPTANLDIFYQYEILELVKTLCEEEGLTIVMVLHDINQTIQYSDRVIIMKAGEMVANGKPEEVITSALLADVYGIKVVMKEDPSVGKYIVPIGI
ncbi:MAG TPA: ABC transporter ATP-binding protein [Sporosarcina sp.]|nr:ABC transporter ATP-binding protein [Sporosarcina sp.]